MSVDQYESRPVWKSASMKVDQYDNMSVDHYDIWLIWEPVNEIIY